MRYEVSSNALSSLGMCPTTALSFRTPTIMLVVTVLLNSQFFSSKRCPDILINVMTTNYAVKIQNRTFSAIRNVF